MDPIAFAWTIAATVFAGLHIFTQKVVAHERRDAALNGIMGYGISALLPALLLVFYDIPSSWMIVALIGILSGLVHGLGSYIRIESLKFIDTVIYFPINKVLGPILVIIGGVWIFGDSLSLREYIGIGLSLTVPLLLVSSAEHHRQRNLRFGIVLLVVSTVLTSLSTLIIKPGVALDSAVMFVMLTAQIAGTISSILIYVRQRGTRMIHLTDIHRRDVELGALNGFLQFLSFYCFLKAVSLGTISLVYVIHAHYILIPIVLAVLVYKDHINARKLLAVVVSLLAIGLLYKA